MVEQNGQQSTSLTDSEEERLPATPGEGEQMSLAKTINEIDPNKVRQIMDAIVTPFHKEGRRSRRDIFLLSGGC